MAASGHPAEANGLTDIYEEVSLSIEAEKWPVTGVQGWLLIGMGNVTTVKIAALQTC